MDLKVPTVMRLPTCNSELRAIDGINPEDNCFREARENGITTVVTGPGSANVMVGQFAALKTYGRRVDDMVIKSPGIKGCFWGEP